MNLWVLSSVAWMNMDKWNNSGRGIEVDLLHRRCYCGVDLSAKLDLTSVVLDFPWKTDTTRLCTTALSPRQQ